MKPLSQADRKIKFVGGRNSGAAKELFRRLLRKPEGFPMRYEQAWCMCDSQCLLLAEVAVWEEGFLKAHPDYKAVQ